MRPRGARSFVGSLQSFCDRCLRRGRYIKVEEDAITDWEITGVQRWLADDFAHICLEMHWEELLGFILVTYTVASVSCAAMHYAWDGGSSIGGDVPPDMHPMEACLWFAAVNIITSGFGAMVPLTTGAYVFSVAAHFLGLILNSLLLGVVVTKASLATAKMVFSNVICVRTRDGIQQLIVRVGNARGNVLYSPDIRLAYVRAVTTAEGETFLQDENLHVRMPVALKPVFFVTHAVTEDSPLAGKSEEDIKKECGFFVLIVSAVDVDTGQSLYARRMYFMKDFRFNHTFEEVIIDKVEGTPILESHGKKQPPSGGGDAAEGFVRHTKVIDFLNFHKTLPLEAPRRPSSGKLCGPGRRIFLAATAREGGGKGVVEDEDSGLCQAGGSISAGESEDDHHAGLPGQILPEVDSDGLRQRARHARPIHQL